MNRIDPVPWPSFSSGRPLLGANAFGATFTLLESDGAPLVDYLKGWPGSDFDVAMRLKTRLPLMLHLGDPICGDTTPSEDRLREVGRWLALASAPWTSVHIIHFDYRAPREEGARSMATEHALDNAVRNARVFTDALPLPLLVENQTAFPSAPSAWVYEPAFVRAVVEQSGCGFLLDLAHARVSADALGIDEHAYLEALPLERVVELHVNGPRRLCERSAERQARALAEERGSGSPFHFGADSLMDAHEPMRDGDYALLEWTLARCQPRAITLEYDREPDALRENLDRLGAMIGRCAPRYVSHDPSLRSG